ncbi:uncharacterized protein LOC141630009 [Silene latifolia]|uniref:uncharacterized protein LOC141630009 n=1 Tax=Silene latifolia TaxID=37657 RepID=UPI003D780B3E
MYNNLFAFSSIGGNTNASTHKGIYVFKLHGQIYHNVPNLLPNDGKPKYLQLYFYDGQHEALNRTGCFPEILLNRDTVLDQREYNAPSDEVAVIWTESSSSSESNTPHITVTAKNNESHRIMHYYGCYDPLQYPLLFPSGECGWVQGLKKLDPESGHAEASSLGSASLDATQTCKSGDTNRKDKIVSCRQYYCYKLQNRPGNMLLRTGRCFQQYVVDMYVKIENTRLDYFRNNQETIRAELYQGILDTIGTGECRAANVGTRIVNKCIFGEVAAYVYVVEFQKRGLPHVHFLIILKDGYKLKCPADYDKFVSAEIPTMDNPSLRKTVLQHMMHGPCGNLNPDCGCMKHSKTPGKCKYEYPKTFTPGTTTNVAGYPEYRRRNSGETAVIRKHRLDNRWVIPYNPYLLTLFDCHLNVEVCSTMHAVKYLYKYIYKGHDIISFSVTENDGPKAVDEISQFQSGRWVSPCEAAWRIFGFDLFETHPAVMALQVHLPNMQLIRLRPTDNLADVLADDKRSRTPLTEFFKKSSTEGCPKRLYGEFTEHYRWDTGTKSWIERRNKVIVIGRLVFVAPAEGERYFLRLLLLHIRGPTSFEDLKTVNGYKCATFQKQRLRHGLFEHDNNFFELSTSGIAASNIPSGRTTHSRFKIPLDCDISLACDIPKQSSLAALIQATSLIIWDEASMAKRQNAESLDLLLRDLCDADHLFGGKVVVFGGDFRQTLPILPRKSQREVVEASLVRSPLWPKLVKFRLTENIRAHTDPEFAEFLLSLGNGALQTKESEYIKMPDGLVSDRSRRCHTLSGSVFNRVSRDGS